ncbi:hypothetical protein DRO97_09630 [Archaeoglobales archaeon]|nr:MAG: hypothetical protein DRO97_09630 [Archaeoglobales archaeon]
MKTKICLLILATVALYGCIGEKPYRVEDRIIFNSSVEVIEGGKPPQIVVSKHNLDFGKIPRGMGVKKEILLENNKNYTVKIIPKVYGTISKWISFDREEITILPHSQAKEVVQIKIPSDAILGNYTGYVVFIIKKEVGG